MALFKNSKILTGLVIVAILLLGYFAYSSISSTPASTSDQGSPVSQNLLLALSNLHTIHLNGSIFSNPVFQSLNDFGVVIPPEPAGRRNPFQPIGTQAQPAPAKQGSH